MGGQLVPGPGAGEQEREKWGKAERPGAQKGWGGEGTGRHRRKIFHLYREVCVVQMSLGLDGLLYVEMKY